MQLQTHTIVINLWLVTTFFIDGFSGAANSLSGLLFGAGAQDKLWPMSIRVLQWTAIFVVAFILIGFGLYLPIGDAFTDGAGVLQYFDRNLRFDANRFAH